MSDKPVEFVDDLEEQEPEPELNPLVASDTVVWSTDWTVETVISQLTRHNIQLPDFQRRDAWTRMRKSRYIESLILGLPIPQIILAETKEQKGNYLVLDGKQRLLSILQFTGSDTGSKNNNFELRGLEVLKDLNGMTLNDIKDDSNFRSFLDILCNQTIRSVVIRNWPNKAFLYMLFARLNTETLPLSPQELRQALYPGDFVKFAEEASRKSQAIKIVLGLNPDESDSRMRDVELLVRYLAFSFYLPEHRGNFKDFLDTTCEKLNKSWSKNELAIRKQVKTLEDAVNASIEIFGGPEKVARKWTEEGFSIRLNKAILDVITFYFSDERIRKKSLAKPKEVVEAFKKLCIQSEPFRNSIETTTKSLSATSTRLCLWGESLRHATGLKFYIPEYKDNRISFTGFW